MNPSEEKSKCEFCSKEIDKYQSSTVKGKLYYRTDRLNKYCSSDCSSAARRRRELIKCEHCSKEFEKLSSRKIRFCSRTCQWDYESIHKERDYKKWVSSRKTILYTHNCINCGTEFTSNSPQSKICSGHCSYLKDKESHHLKRKERAKNRKLRLIELSNGGCSICGYNKCLRALSFHHENPENKLFTLDSANLYRYTWEEIFNEFKKCKLLCMNCHMEEEDKILEQTSKIST